MPRPRISSAEKGAIIELFLAGLTRDDVARKLGLSTGSVSSVISEFADDARSSSLSDASSRYGVCEIVDALRDLARSLKKARLTVQEAKSGAEFLAKTSTIGISLERLAAFVSFCQRITPQGYPLDHFISASVRLSEMEEKTGLSAEQIVAQHESGLAESKALEARIQALKSETERLASEKDRAEADFKAETTRLDADLHESLELHKLTLERVDRVSRIDQALKKYGVEIEKPETLLHFLDVVEQLGYNAKKAVEYMTEEDSLQSATRNLRDEKAALGGEISGLTAQKAALRANLDKTNAELQKANLLLDTRDKLLERGYTDSSLSTLADLTMKLGGAEEVFSSIRCYESLGRLDAKRLELEQTIAKLSTEEDEARKSLGEIKRRLKPLREEHEYTARKCAELRKELESYDGIVKAALCLSALRSGDQETIKNTPIDALVSLLEPVNAWCKWKQNELEKETRPPIEISVGTLCSFLIDGLRRIRGG